MQPVGQFHYHQPRLTVAPVHHQWNSVTVGVSLSLSHGFIGVEAFRALALHVILGSGYVKADIRVIDAPNIAQRLL